MNLRTTRRITYTTAPSAADLAALEQIAAIDAKAKPTKAEKEERAALAAGLGAVTQLRATVGTMSALQAHRYQQARRIVYQWVEAETGQPFGEATDTPDGAGLLMLAIKWALGTAALIKLETREINPTADDGAAAWQEIERPEAWATPGGYLDNCPPELVAELDNAARAVNPGINGAPPAPGLDDPKKTGGISVD